MSTIAIGDVHGHLAALNDLLNQVAREISAEDTVVFLGDYIDRGPDSQGCIQRILEFRRTSAARVIALMGNHEQWLLRTYRDHTSHSWLLGMEGFQTIRSYSATAAARLREEADKVGHQLFKDRVALPYDVFFRALPPEHLTFLTTLPAFCRTADAVCVHGGLNPDRGRVEDQRSEDLIWGTDGFPERYQGGESVVYGHANDPVVDPNGWPRPRIRGRTYGLDTISHGVLTALRLPEGVVIQSDRHSRYGV